jgi:hypothetical protein
MARAEQADEGGDANTQAAFEAIGATLPLGSERD